MSHAVTFCIFKQRFYKIKLMIAWKYLLVFSCSGILIFLRNDLSVVLNNVGYFIFCEDTFPKIVGFQTIWINGISGTVIISFVKGQKPGFFAF